MAAAKESSKKKKKFILRPGGVLPEGVTEEEISIRWYPEEQKAIDFIRSELKDQLDARNSTVDSDSRLMRFLRRHNLDPVNATANYREHIAWRESEGLDDKHDFLIANNLDPKSVPNGKRVVELMPQIPCCFDKCDLVGNPLSIEYYGFNPENALHFTPEEYLDWFLYSMEYKMLIVEHFSLLAEERAVAHARQTNEPLEPGWGSRALRRLCVIRDLKGFQLSSSLTPRIPFIKELLRMSQANYPYLTDHSFFTNTPWMFSVVWSVLKTTLSTHTRSKLHMYASDYHSSIEKFIANESLPKNLQRPGTKSRPSSSSSSASPTTASEPRGDSLTFSNSATTSLEGLSRTHLQEPIESSSLSRSDLSSSSTGSVKSPKPPKPPTSSASVILSISEVECSLANPPLFSRLTIKSRHSQNEGGEGGDGVTVPSTWRSEDSQQLSLPLQTRHFFVLSLSEGNIIDNMLTLDFDLTLGSSEEGEGEEEGKDTSNKKHVFSNLQVLIHPEVAIESLLCWVNFYDENNNSLCMLKVVLSYQPLLHTNQSKSTFSSFFKKKKNKKKQMTNDLLSSFKAQQVISPKPPATPNTAATFNRRRSSSGGGGSDDEDDIERHFEQSPPTTEDGDLVDVFSSYFQFDQSAQEGGVDGGSEVDDDMMSVFSWSPQSGVEVPLDDTSTEWAIFSCSAIEVRKFAFETESEAREALEDWSFANILTKSNIEVAATGIILAPNMGRIREAIDVVRPSPQSLIRDSSVFRTPNEDGGGGGGEASGGGESSVLVTGTGGNPDGGSIKNVNSDWAVWTSEFFMVQRYGFDNEVDAKSAMDEWMSVRILTYKEEEVNARQRWHTDAILAIRNAIATRKK